MPDASAILDRPTALPRRSLHVMTKPIGAICNLDCAYCFYLEKERLYPEKTHVDQFRMTDEVLETYVRQFIAHHDGPEIQFAWQGGEPTLVGLDFYRRAIELQAIHCPAGKRIGNALQTNGTLLDDEWCAFFRKHDFLIGLSIDGPREFHDRYRVNKAGHGTFDAVMRGWKLLKAHGVQYNTLTVVNRAVGDHPRVIYDFLKDNGATFLQFIPLVERKGTESHTLAEPPLLRISTPATDVTDWSVLPEQYGSFMSGIFDYWVRHDVGRIFVQLFDAQLGIELGLGSSLCVFAETCGGALAMEHNGDLYACDHFVYPKFKLGNVMNQTITEMADSPGQQKFGKDKRDALPGYCIRCEVRRHCNGECPKHRFILTPDGEPGLNYLCAGYKKLFAHMKPYLKSMADLLRQGHPASQIMEMLTLREGNAGREPMPAHRPPSLAAGLRRTARPVGRNDACPCGSGRKFKKCCGK